MKIKILTLLIMLLSVTMAGAQMQASHVFPPGEELRLTGSYYMSRLWTDIAEIKLSVTEIKQNNRKVLRLQGTAQTFAEWDNFFRIRDSYTSWVEPVEGKPLLYRRLVDEGGFKKDLKYVFKHKNGLAESTEILASGYKRELEIAITPNTHEMLSALYAVRLLDFENMKKGDVHSIDVLIDTKMQKIMVKFLGRENQQIPGRGLAECYVLGLGLNDDKILKNKSGNKLWLSADKHRYPVLLKADIPVGSIQVRLVEIKTP